MIGSSFEEKFKDKHIGLQTHEISKHRAEFNRKESQHEAYDKGYEKLEGQRSQENDNIIVIDSDKEQIELLGDRKSFKTIRIQDSLQNKNNSFYDINGNQSSFQKEKKALQTQAMIHSDKQSKLKSASKLVESTIYPFMINNLLAIQAKVPSKVFKLYLQQIAEQHKINFNKLLISFGIEAIIAKFYETHELGFMIRCQYFYSQLEQCLPNLMVQANICSWSTVVEICLGLLNRFEMKNNFDEDWLISTMKKNKKLFQQHSIDYQQILKDSKTKQGAIADTNYQQPSASDISYYGYKGIVEYLSRQNKSKSIQLQPPNYQQPLDRSDKRGTSNQLNYYKRLEEKVLERKGCKKMELNLVKQNAMEEQNQLPNSFYQIIDFEIIKISSNFTNDIQLLSDFDEDRDISAQLEQIPSKQSVKQKGKQDDSLKKMKNKKYRVCKTVSTSNQISQQEHERSSDYAVYSQKKAKHKAEKKIHITSKANRSSSESSLLNINQQNQSKSKELDFQKELEKIDLFIFKFYESGQDNSKLTIDDISKLMKQFLEQTKVAEEHHNKLMQLWFTKYSSQ